MGDGLVASFAVRRGPEAPVIECDLRWDTGGAPVLVLFGPSGAGKTTMLRALAGLEPAAAGEIVLGEETWLGPSEGVPARRRRVGFVPQEPLLFPHLSIADNIAFGIRRLAAADRARRVAEMVLAVGLAGLEARRPYEVSGGQRQRAALARALAPRPRLLLLDEPLSALDEASRASLRAELRSIILASGTPAVVVTHDRTEALELGDIIAVMDDGRILQVGPVEEVFSRPADPGVARIVGIETVIAGRVEPPVDGISTVGVGSARLSAVNSAGLVGEAFVCIRAVDVILQSAGSGGADSARNHLPGTVSGVTEQDPLVRVGIDCGFGLVALITRSSRREMGIHAGSQVVAVLKAPAIHLVARGAARA